GPGPLDDHDDVGAAPQDELVARGAGRRPVPPGRGSDCQWSAVGSVVCGSDRTSEEVDVTDTAMLPESWRGVLGEELQQPYYKEMKEELGTPIPDNGYLMPWAEQGVLLLNAVLTVRSGEANSHKGKGWEKFTDAVIRAVAGRPDPAVFVLWGNYAQKKHPLID